MPVTTPFPFTKNKVAKEQPTHMSTTTTTTIRPKSAAKATPSWNRNTARPQPAAPSGYSQFQLDPALLHNGFLFDKVSRTDIYLKGMRTWVIQAGCPTVFNIGVAFTQ